MDDKTLGSITRILLIIAIFLGVLSLILPWGQISVGAFGKVDFYCWGISGVSIFGSTESTTELYVSFFFNEDFMTLLSESGNFLGFIAPMVFGVFVVPLLLVGLILGAMSLFKVGKREQVNTRDAAIWLVVAVVFYYLFIQFGLLTLLNSSFIAFSNLFSYTIGYVVVVLSVIIVVGVYIVEKGFYDSSKKGGKSSEDESDVLRLLKERYVKGEISKDEFDQMKKDIE